MQNPTHINRRTALKDAAAFVGASCFASAFASVANANDLERKRLLFFTKSAGFQHSVVTRDGTELAYAERIMMELGKKHNLDVHCSKDGRIFDKDYEQFDGYFFFTTLDLTTVGTDGQPAMSVQGKRNFLESISNGKGFAGSHSASDTFHTEGEAFKNQSTLDPYIQMIGGEFIRHGRQQEATMKIVSDSFPGLPKTNGKTIDPSFRLNDEWYSLKNFAKDMHVILVQDTEGMQDDDYKRPIYPATWARSHGKGRVFYTSMGHREDVWPNPLFESILMGGLNWTLGRMKAEIPSNLEATCPGAFTLPVLS